MEIESGRVEFPAGTGARYQRYTLLFSKKVVTAHVALSGYEARYTNDDHHLKALTVKLTAKPGARLDEGYEVYVDVTFDLHDQDSNDRFAGSVDFVVFAEFEGRVLPQVLEA